MAVDPDLRLKIRHFLKKHQRLIIFIIVILIIIITINRILISLKPKPSPTTTYTPHISVLDNTSEVPDKVEKSFENFIEKYVIYCNTGDYTNAWNLVSKECKENLFDNSYTDFVEYVQTKFNSHKRYAIQDYSNYNDKYIYSVKIFDDYLATGLTNQTYLYQEEKMVASYDENKNVVFSVGNYMDSKEINAMNANEYLRVEVKEAIEKYGFIIYKVKFTNIKDYTVVIQDENSNTNEVLINVGSENRGPENIFNIILKPGETKEVELSFAKFYDSNLVVNSLILNSIRILENYTGDPELAEQEIENAIDKFSMTIPLN